MRELKFSEPDVEGTRFPFGFSPDYEGIEILSDMFLQVMEIGFSPDYEGIEIFQGVE